jgi:hypothetical protein
MKGEGGVGDASSELSDGFVNCRGRGVWDTPQPRKHRREMLHQLQPSRSFIRQINKEHESRFAAAF